MLSLLIDSCTERSVLAIVKDGSVVYRANLPFGLHHSKYLLPKMEEGFHFLNKHPQDLDFIAVGVGPGSYTGMRVGASIAKSLSYCCKVPLIGICSLKGFIPEKQGHFAALIDARMSGVYLLKGEKSEEGIRYALAPEMSSIEEMEEKLEGIERLVGPSLGSIKEKTLCCFPSFGKQWQELEADPLHLNKLGEEKFRDKKFSLDGSLRLIYMRETL